MRNILIIAALILGLWSCRVQPETESEQAKAQLSIVTRAGVEQGTEDENRVTKLRVVGFYASNGMQCVNLLLTDAALSALSTAGGSYSTVITVPKNDIEIYLIANEQTSLSNNIMDKAALQSKALDYKGIDPASPFVMFARRAISSSELDAATPSVEIALKRTIAKVSLTLSCDYSQVGGLDGGKIIVDKAFIDNTPDYPELGENREYDYTKGFSMSSVKPFAFVSLNDAGFSTQPLEIYIPEHILSGGGLADGMYTNLIIQGRYIKGGNTIDIVYRLPFGDGLDGHTGVVPPVNELTKEKLTVSRNTHYKIEGKVTSIGELDGIQFAVKVKDWSFVDIDIPSRAPYLNVSDIALDVEMYKSARIYFWTNQPNPFVEATATVDDTYGSVITDATANIFDGDAKLTIFPYDTDPEYIKYSGYIDLRITNGNYAANEITITLNAGGLRRKIKIKSIITVN